MRKTALVSWAILLCVELLFPACSRKADPTAQVRHYDSRGIVRGLSPDRQTIEIEHEDIPEFMPSMTMPFLVRDLKETADRKVGEAISFRITVTNKELFIDRLQPIAVNDLHLPTHAATPDLGSGVRRLHEGDSIPSFSLVDQDGNRVTPETFNGRPFVLTFIFTRCPVPNFCPLMSNNFAELQQAIKTGTGSLTNVHLLSVTLDPGFDTPQILKDYSASRKADSAIWTFVTGQPAEIDPLVAAFSVYRQTEGGTLSHGLATALINPDGTIKKIWRGNGWTPVEVIAAIQTTNGHE